MYSEMTDGFLFLIFVAMCGGSFLMFFAVSSKMGRVELLLREIAKRNKSN
jgi:hypothetical protein